MAAPKSAGDSKPDCRSREDQEEAPSGQIALDNYGIPYEIVETERPGHATELAASASHNGFDVLAAMGGDGTLSEVVNGLMQVEKEAQRPPQSCGDTV